MSQFTKKGQPPSHKTPFEKIEQCRQMRTDGMTYAHIAQIAHIGESTVKRYTKDIPLVQKKPLPTNRVTSLLAAWPVAQ